jgi:NAD(P)-dependent dehydrogenase (short-subunit alcohol dehydrogenase family)
MVTGAGAGIGRAVALALAREGARVVVVDVDEAAAEETVRLAGGGVAVRADVTDDDELRAAFAAAGPLDVLVNNAGIMTRGLYAEAPVKAYAEMFAINVTGTMLCARAALPTMIAQRRGRIVNFSSQLARFGVGNPGFAAYATTKGAVEAFTRALAHEVGMHGITVNAVAPGGIETDMSKAVMTPEYRAKRLAELPLRRFGDVDDVAACTVFLASDGAGYLTGQVLQPNGGWIMP